MSPIRLHIKILAYIQLNHKVTHKQIQGTVLTCAELKKGGIVMQNIIEIKQFGRVDGYFTTEESWVIVNALNGPLDISERPEKNELVRIVQNYFNRTRTKKFQQVNEETLLNKLTILSEVQAKDTVLKAKKFLDIDCNEELNHESEDVLKDIFMIVETEEDYTHNHFINDYSEIDEGWLEVASEKIRHVRTLLRLRYNLLVTIVATDGGFDLYVNCDSCFSLHYLEFYSIEELIELDVASEAKYLVTLERDSETEEWLKQ